MLLIVLFRCGVSEASLVSLGFAISLVSCRIAVDSIKHLFQKDMLKNVLRSMFVSMKFEDYTSALSSVQRR